MNDIHESFMSYAIDLAKKELGYSPEYSLKNGMLNSLKELYN